MQQMMHYKVVVGDNVCAVYCEITRWVFVICQHAVSFFAVLHILCCNKKLISFNERDDGMMRFSALL